MICAAIQVSDTVRENNKDRFCRRNMIKLNKDELSSLKRRGIKGGKLSDDLCEEYKGQSIRI